MQSPGILLSAPKGRGKRPPEWPAGYSSLAYLKRLPVTEIKIDKSFVIEMTEHDNDEIIVKSTIDLGHNLGFTVVAEGVETLETWKRLAELGCHLAQGFLLSRPMPAAGVTAWLEDFHEKPFAERFPAPPGPAAALSGRREADPEP